MKLPGSGLSWKQFFSDLKDEWTNNMLSDVAGSVTFFALLSLFPFLLFLVSLASLFIDPSGAASLVESIRHAAPSAATQIVGDRIKSLATQKSVGLLTIGAITTIWSASGGVTSLMNALNTCYGVKESRPFWKYRGIAILMTFFVAAISILSAAAAVALPPLANHIGGPVGEILLWLRMPAAAVLMMFLWAVIYYVLPDVEQKFKFITPGSVTGVLLWLIASYAFSLYVTHFGNYEVTYGTLGGVIILLLWMWISSLTLLLGAEINAIIEHRSPEGKRVGAKSMAQTGEDVPKHEKEEQEKRRRERPMRPAPQTVTGVMARSAKNAAGTMALGFLLRSLIKRRQA